MKMLNSMHRCLHMVLVELISNSFCHTRSPLRMAGLKLQPIHLGMNPDLIDFCDVLRCQAVCKDCTCVAWHSRASGAWRRRTSCAWRRRTSVAGRITRSVTTASARGDTLRFARTCRTIPSPNRSTLALRPFCSGWGQEDQEGQVGPSQASLEGQAGQVGQEGLEEAPTPNPSQEAHLPRQPLHPRRQPPAQPTPDVPADSACHHTRCCETAQRTGC